MPATLAARVHGHLTSWTATHRLALPRCARPAASVTAAAASCLLVTSEEAMACLAQLLQSIRERGDCICLYGNVGAGKSAFCRSYIRAACNDPYLAVPSPTFLLKNTYEPLEGPPVHHYDLYRLKELVHTERLDLPISFKSATTLIEWPQIAHSTLPAERLNIHITALPTDVEQSMRSSVEQSIYAAQAITQDQNGSMSESGYTLDPSEEEDILYMDVNWRAVALEPIGPRWAAAVREVQKAVQQSADIIAEGIVVAPTEIQDHLNKSIQEAAESATSTMGNT